jgi:predicted enzyme related to lactoylglutathione lyase
MDHQLATPEARYSTLVTELLGHPGVTHESGSAWRSFGAGSLKVEHTIFAGGPEYYVFKRGEQMLCAVMQTDPAWGAFPPQWITYFGVVDADAAVAAVTANGGRALSPIEPTPFGRMAALSDPAGVQFKIVEVPAS